MVNFAVVVVFVVAVVQIRRKYFISVVAVVCGFISCNIHYCKRKLNCALSKTGILKVRGNFDRKKNYHTFLSV